MPLTTSSRGQAGPAPTALARHVAAPDRRRRSARLARTVGVLLLLAGLVTAGSPGWFTYTIRQGDTLSEIAARYHTTVAKLVQANRLPGNGNLIYAGDALRIPGGSSHGGGGGGTRHHAVVRGDTLSEIALHYGVSAGVIAKANHLPTSLIVRIGQTLVIPGRRSPGHSSTHTSSNSSANSFAGRTYPSATVAAAAHNRAVLARRHLPSRDQMRDLIVSISRANGVDPSLALAISWQEAGWQMHHVSVANAIGAMQVVPSTGEWISQVIGRRLDLLKPRDNVTAGVILLKVLSEQASERQTIAGYYQGLRSVHDHGMYPDTRRYVANVMAIKRWYD